MKYHFTQSNESGKWFLKNEMRHFYDFSSLRKFVISLWITGCDFRIIIGRNRQFDGNYGTIENHKLHKRACHSRSGSYSGDTISIDSLRITPLPIPPLIRLKIVPTCGVIYCMSYTVINPCYTYLVMYAETYCIYITCVLMSKRSMNKRVAVSLIDLTKVKQSKKTRHSVILRLEHPMIHNYNHQVQSSFIRLWKRNFLSIHFILIWFLFEIRNAVKADLQIQPLSLLII